MSNLDTTAAMAPTELIVVIEDDPGFAYAEYRGTRAMLEAESVLPKDTEFPSGYENLRWVAGNYYFWLRRRRPPGAKGPRRQFIDCDWFHLRWGLKKQPPWEQRGAITRERELQVAIYRASPEGRLEEAALFKRYWASVDDAKFQAFKAAVPGLAKRKRGRHNTSAAQAQGAAA